MTYLGIFKLKFENNIVIFELNSKNLSNFKVSWKNWRCLNLIQKMIYLGIFGLEFEKTIVRFEINSLKFLKNVFLTHTVNFGIWSAFSKGPALYQGPRPSPGLLYKVWRQSPHLLWLGGSEFIITCWLI